MKFKICKQEKKEKKNNLFYYNNSVFFSNKIEKNGTVCLIGKKNRFSNKNCTKFNDI